MKRLILPLVGLIAAGSALAYPEARAIEEALRATTQGLTALSQQESPCQGDIGIAAAYVRTAEIKVHYQYFTLALTDLGYAQRELEAIATTRDWCRDLAPKVIPFIPQVRDLKAQVELLSRGQE